MLTLVGAPLLLTMLPVVALRGQPGIRIDAGSFARDLDAGDRSVVPVAGIELVGEFALVVDDIGRLIAAQRVGGQRVSHGIG